MKGNGQNSVVRSCIQLHGNKGMDSTVVKP